MRIFFLASVQGKEKFGDNYQFIYDKIKGLGHKIDSEPFFDTSENQLNDWMGSQDLLSFHKKITEQIKKCDVLIVELSHQRVSMGYWLSMALEMGKPCIGLCVKGPKYHLLETLELSQKFVLYEYGDLKDLDKELPMLIEFAAEQQDTRFNFFISPKHQNYLDWVAKTKKVPRSVYLRQLIEQDMIQNPEFFESDFVK